MTNMSTQSKIKPEVVVPVAAGIAGAGLGAASTALLAAPVLGLVGFSSIGPVAGTLAASIQASIGSVAAGSLFAGAQSIAMGGMAVPPVAIVLGGIAIGVAIYFGTRALMRYLKRRKERKVAEKRAKKGKH
ncbi:interferon alpha-inducible protein 6-like protein, partial [Mycena maculata]